MYLFFDVCRRIIGLGGGVFKHSIGTLSFEAIKKKLTTTSYSSTLLLAPLCLYMMQIIWSRRLALAAYATEYDLPQLIASQLALASGCY